MEKKTKKCPKCGFVCKGSYVAIEEYFGYRTVSDKGQPAPQSYCRECRSNKEEKPIKKKKKEATKIENDVKAQIKETYKKMFPEDKNRRGYDYMAARIKRANAKSA